MTQREVHDADRTVRAVNKFFPEEHALARDEYQVEVVPGVGGASSVGAGQENAMHRVVIEFLTKLLNKRIKRMNQAYKGEASTRRCL